MTTMLKNKVIKEIAIYILIICLFINPGLIGIAAFKSQRGLHLPSKQNKKASVPAKTIQKKPEEITGEPVAKYNTKVTNNNTNYSVTDTGNYYKTPTQQNVKLETKTNPQTTNITRSTIPISADQYQILVRLIKAEAGGEPFEGQVAVAAVLLNRIRSGKFPTSISGNVFRKGEFESVSNGYIWYINPTPSSHKAAALALKGWDPTGGSLYFFNPAKSTSRWIWSRPIYTKIGNHYFAG